jgi:phosphohistidine phosphatase
MKRLILMRHAKSDWSYIAASDHEHTLNARGIRSAKAMGLWLREHGLAPDYVLCSDAARTVETLGLLDLGTVQATLTRTLYLAEPDMMLDQIQKRTEETVLFLGHNPGIGALAQMLVTDAPDHPDFYSYPTCATLVAEFDIAGWHDLRSGTGDVLQFIVPRQLTE